MLPDRSSSRITLTGGEVRAVGGLVCPEMVTVVRERNNGSKIDGRCVSILTPLIRVVSDEQGSFRRRVNGTP
jgi:hypothetical protein